MEWVAVFFSVCMLLYVAMVFRSAWHFRYMRPEEHLPAILPFVSIVIPARNEERRIAACLHSVLQQQYPAGKFEVILVNDHSTDATKAIATVFATRNPQLRVIDLESQGINAYKKAALSAGIAAAQGEIILQTDADCEMGTGWLYHMVSHFDADTALVSGPVRLLSQDHWLEHIQALESMGLVALGAGSMAARRPNMCNGANLAYRKSVFEEAGGFGGPEGVASGDDEFLLQKIRRLERYNMRFAKSREAIVYTFTLSNWADLKAQRLRWVSKVRNYIDRRVNGVQLVSYLAFCSFPVLLLLSFFDLRYLVLLIEILILKSCGDFLLMYEASRFFRNPPILKWLPLLEILYIPYVLWIGLAGNAVKNYTWKGREVR